MPSRRRYAPALAAIALMGTSMLTGAAPAAGAPGDLPELGCAQQTGVALGYGVTLGCSTASTGPGSTFPAHVVTLDLSTTPRLDVVPANGTVWQFQDPSAPGYLPDAPVSAMLPADAAVAINGGYFDIRQASGSYTGTACGGMVTAGRILKTPALNAQGQANLVQLRNGQLYLGAVGYTGQVLALDDPRAGIALTSVNDLADAGKQQRCPPLVNGDDQSPGTGLTMITPDMGPVTLPPTTGSGANAAQFQIPDATVVFGQRVDTTMTVTAVNQYSTSPALSSLPPLTGNQVALVTSAAAAKTWLAAHATVGAKLRVDGSLTINGVATDQIQTLIGAGTTLIADGTNCPVTNTEPFAPNCGGSFPLGDGDATSPHQETMVGVTRDGRHAFIVAVDQLSNTDGGIAPTQDAAYMASLGAYQAVLFDGGGSTALVGRTAPGGAPTLFSARYFKPQDPAGPNNQRYVANAIVVRAAKAPPSPQPTPSPTVTPHPAATPTTTPAPVLAATSGVNHPGLWGAVAICLVGSGSILWYASGRPGQPKSSRSSRKPRFLRFLPLP